MILFILGHDFFFPVSFTVTFGDFHYKSTFSSTGFTLKNNTKIKVSRLVYIGMIPINVSE